MPPTLLCVVALAALLATSTLAVSSIRSSFMQVEADDTRCYFSYYGIFQNNNTVRGTRVAFSIFELGFSFSVVPLLYICAQMNNLDSTPL
jgi:hypothetical protein